MDVDRVILGIVKVAVLNRDLPAAAGHLNHVRRGRGFCALARVGGHIDVVNGDVLGELADDCKGMQEIGVNITDCDVFALP